MALRSQGCTIGVGNGASPEVFALLAEITTVSGVGSGTAAEIDVTNLSSTGKEFLMGLKDEGSITVNGFLDPDDTAGQTVLRTMRDDQTSKNFRISLTDSPATTVTFAAFVTQFGFDIGIDGAIPLNVTLRVTGSATYA